MKTEKTQFSATKSASAQKLQKAPMELIAPSPEAIKRLMDAVGTASNATYEKNKLTGQTVNSPTHKVRKKSKISFAVLSGNSENPRVGKVVKKGTLQIAMLSYGDLEKGIAASEISAIAAKGLTRDDIRMIIPDRTLERRIAEGAALKLEEADGILRLSRVWVHTMRAFGDERLANLWLRNPNPALESRVPIQMARTDLGGREVEAVLYRIEYGVFS